MAGKFVSHVNFRIRSTRVTIAAAVSNGSFLRFTYVRVYVRALQRETLPERASTGAQQERSYVDVCFVQGEVWKARTGDSEKMKVKSAEREVTVGRRKKEKKVERDTMRIGSDGLGGITFVDINQGDASNISLPSYSSLHTCC